MARPCKSAKVLTEYSQTKAEISARIKAEDKIRGDDVPVAPEWLSEGQRRIFDGIVDMLVESEILSGLDVYILLLCAVAADRLQFIETKINSDPVRLGDKDLISAREKYAKDFFRCCNELCLSPQSRAKIANIAATKKDKEPLLEALR